MDKKTENQVFKTNKNHDSMIDKLIYIYRFFRLFNRPNKKNHKNKFTRQFNLKYIKTRQYAIMQAIDFYKLKKYDEKNLEKLIEESKSNNVIAHNLEIDKYQLEVPDIDNQNEIMRINAKNNMRVEHERKRIFRPRKR